MKIRVYGEKGALEWQHTDCNSLYVRWPDRPAQIYRTGSSYIFSGPMKNTRVPSGHPEGYIEAFANIYRNFALAVKKKRTNQNDDDPALDDFPGVREGIRSLAFIEACLKNSQDLNEKWTEIKE